MTKDTFIGINPYLYTANNPVDRSDPDGNAWWRDAINWVKNVLGIQDEVDGISGTAPHMQSRGDFLDDA